MGYDLDSFPQLEMFIQGAGKGEQSFNHNAVVGVAYEDKLVVSDYHYCYGMLNRWSGEYGRFHRDSPSEGLTGIYLQVQNPQPACDLDATKHWFEWLFNHSPFRDVFISKDVNDVLDDSVIVVDPHSESSVFGNGLIASRMPWEHYSSTYEINSRVSLWYDLVNAGMHPNYAFMLIHMMITNHFKGGVWSFSSYIPGHMPLQIYDEVIRRFVEEKNEKWGQWSHRFRYAGPNHTTYEAYGMCPDNDISMSIQKLMRELKGEKVNNNPFAQNTLSTFVERKIIIENTSAFSEVFDKAM